MAEDKQNEDQAQNEEQAGEAPAPQKKLTPLEAKKAQQAAMRTGKGGQPHAAGGGSQAGGGSASARKPAIQSRKMG